MQRDYWSVYSPQGRKIADCGAEGDAISLASKVAGRTYRKNRILRDQVIDVAAKVDGELPGQQGLPPATFKVGGKELAAQQSLPVSDSIPFNV